MKLKEKLAKEYSRSVCGISLKDMPSLNAHIPEYMNDAFEAGFEKAREMAVKRFKSADPFYWIEFEMGEEETE